jgi:hypothetical protein
VIAWQGKGVTGTGRDGRHWSGGNDAAVAVAVAVVTLSLRGIFACMKGARKNSHQDARGTNQARPRRNNPHRVSIEPGCERRFASVKTGPKERSGNQTPQHCIRRTRTSRMRPTNHALGGTTGATKMISKPVERSALQRKPCPDLALRLTLSPNGSKRVFTWPTSLRRIIGNNQNDFGTYGTFDANCAPMDHTNSQH